MDDVIFVFEIFDVRFTFCHFVLLLFFKSLCWLLKSWIEFGCCHWWLRTLGWECVNKNESVVFSQLFIQFKLNKKNLFIALIWWTWDNNSSLSLKINLSVSGKAWSRKKLLLKKIESFDFFKYGLNFDAIFLVVSHPTTNHGWRNFSIFTRNIFWS